MTPINSDFVLGSLGGLVLAVFGFRWLWRHIPHPHHDLLVRLSEILVAIKQLTEAMKQPAAQPVITAPPELAAIEELLKQVVNGQAAELGALDVTAERIKKQGEYVQLFCRTLTGNDPNSYREVTDEDAVVREQAIRLQQRYKISYEEALTRAKRMQPYFSTEMGFGAEG